MKKKAEKEIIDLSRFPSENPNPVLRVSNDLRIIYANTPAKIIIQKLGLKSKKISKKLIESVRTSIKRER